MKDEEMAEQFANGLLIAKGKDPVYRYREWFYWRRAEPIAWCEIPTFDME